jgi:hypothetical protein
MKARWVKKTRDKAQRKENGSQVERISAWARASNSSHIEA